MSKKYIISGFNYKIQRAIRKAKAEKEAYKNRRLRKGLVCATAASLCLMAGAGCKTNSPSQPNGKEPLAGIHTFNAFDTFSDIMRLAPNGAQYSTQYCMDICKEANYTHDGAGSLRYDFEGGTSPSLVLRIANSLLTDMDVTDLKTVSLWVYNDKESDEKISLDVVDTSLISLISQEFELPAKEWTQVVLPVNAIVTKYRSSEIDGFSFKFLTGETGTFYIDDMRVEFGRVITEEDNAYLAEVEKIISDIDALPEKITASDSARIEEIFNAYNALPSLYKMGVSNYKDLYVILEDMRQIVYNAETSLTERTAFYFDKPWGLTQIQPYGVKQQIAYNEIEYSTEIKHGDESGSLKLLFDGDQWNYFAPVAQATLSQYDYVSFYVYNEGDLPKVFWFNWEARANIDPGVWTHVEMPTSVFLGQGGQLIVTSAPKTENGYGGATAAYGALYFSRITCRSLGVDTLYAPVLNAAEPLKVSGADMIVNSDGYKLTATDSNVIVTLNKQTETISVAQKVAFRLKLPFAATLTLFNKTGENIGTVSANEGWNIVKLTAQQYNALVSVSIPALSGKTIEVGNFLEYKSSEESPVMLIMEEEFLPSADSITGADIEKAIKTVDAFYGLSAYYRNRLATEEKEVYNRIVAKQKKVNEFVVELIENTSLSDNNASARFLLRNIYEAYTESVNFPDLTNAQKEKAVALIEQTNRLPLPIYDMSNAADRTKLSMNMTFAWTGMLSSVKTQEEGMTLGLILLDGNSTETNATIAYDHSGKSLVGYEFIMFKVYNPRTIDRNLHLIKNEYATGSKGKIATLKAGAWTEVCVSVADFLANGCLCLDNIGRNAEDAFLITSFYAYNKAYIEDAVGKLPNSADVTEADRAQIERVRYLYENLSSASKKQINVEKLVACESKLVMGVIATLPEAENLTAFDGQKISAAQAAYDELPEEGKLLVTNVDKLQSLVSAYENTFVVVADMNTTNGFSLHGGYTQSAQCTLSIKNDETYGNYLNAASTAGIGGEQLAIKYSIPDLSTKLEGCDKVYFYVYNGHTADRTMLCDFGGSLKTNYITLKSQAWTLVEVSVADFISGSYFGIFNAKYASSCDYKFSMIYATKTAA